MMAYQINSDRILFTQLGDEGVVFDTQKNEYLSLNETFFKILKGVEMGKSQTEIVADLCKEYEIDEAKCQQEVANVLLQLQEKEYIQQ